MSSKYIIIFNPVAGKGYAPKHIPIINDFLQRYGCNYEIHLTKQAGHAIKLAEEFGLLSENVIVAAGGDGTCNEVINGLMNIRDRIDFISRLAVIPVGRGNDFAYGAHIPANLEDSLQTLVKGTEHKLDIGKVNGGDYPEGRFFGNGIGVGFDTIVGLEAAKMKHVHGAAAYIFAAVKTLIMYPPAPTVKLSYDDSEKTINPALVSIMNGNRMGGTFFMSPEANNSDGVLNLCMTRQGKRRELLRAMLHYTKGTQSTLENTITLQSSSFSLQALKGNLAVHADGETICKAGKDISIECIPAALKIIR